MASSRLSPGAPGSPAKGWWTADDWCHAGVFIDLPDRHGYIAFPALATGRIGYDSSALARAGKSQYWYVYDPCELGLAAKGERKPWEVMPHSITHVDYPSDEVAAKLPLGAVTGACYDEQEKLLYLNKTWAVAGEFPAIHVYRLK